MSEKRLQYVNKHNMPSPKRNIRTDSMVVSQSFMIQ